MKTNKLGAEALQREAGGVTTVTFPRLADENVLRHAISTRAGGVSRGSYRSLNLSHKVQDDASRVEENRTLLSRALGMDLGRVVHADQVHGDRVLKLNAANRPSEGGSLGEGDGIITNEKGIPIMLMVADCLPVLFYDPTHQAAGLAHAGWRGTVSHVAAKTLLAMGEAYGTRPEEVRAVLGPCIGACCYEVGEDVRKEFSDIFPWAPEVFTQSSARHWKLDLAEANARQLLEIGLQDENLIRSGLCTIRHNSLFYSHRAEAFESQSTGRFGAFMMLNS
ncbi:MAG TPA: peptidoglycan editing factor PgeF [bacterium]|nr:peptidoglycan editing factor PgeF [bacterium]